jgi:hypothetical protein
MSGWRSKSTVFIHVESLQAWIAWPSASSSTIGIPALHLAHRDQLLDLAAAMLWLGERNRRTPRKAAAQGELPLAGSAEHSEAARETHRTAGGGDRGADRSAAGRGCG